MSPERKISVWTLKLFCSHHFQTNSNSHYWDLEQKFLTIMALVRYKVIRACHSLTGKALCLLFPTLTLNKEMIRNEKKSKCLELMVWTDS